MNPFTPLRFKSGHESKNRFLLAPMTNTQSHPNGQLSEDEFHWLKMRAEGGFGITMTCAAHVQKEGQGFPGQLGIYSDTQIPGHQKLVKAIQTEGSLAVIQLHHAGMRSPKELIGTQPQAPSNLPKYGARGLTIQEVEQLRDDFIAAAVRAQKCGYDGVEIHGAHGYILAQFLSVEHNQRNDRYGGSLENRARLSSEIMEGIRKACGPHFLLGIRLSPERFGMRLAEIKSLTAQWCAEGKIDFIDLSLWDVFKEPIEKEHRGQSLMAHFNEIDRGSVKFTVAGKIDSGAKVQAVLDAGIDFVAIGRSAVLHHDFPVQVEQNPQFETIAIPVSVDYLSKEGLGPDFITYMRRWEGFVKD